MSFIPKPVLTIDIVDFSLRSVQEQMEAVQALIKMLGMAIPLEWNKETERIWSPSGDGGSLTFWNSIHAAAETAINLGRLINEYNEGKFVDEQGRRLPKPPMPFKLRTGLHSGTVSKEIDFDNRENVWGDGMNTSARVSSMARPGQILASEDFYNDAGLRSWPGLDAKPIGKWWTKHNKSLVLYNIYVNGVGIPYSEVEEWFGPFHYPLEQAISTYEAMAREEVMSGQAFRAAVLAKRLLDLNPQNSLAQEIIESISEKRFKRALGEKVLYNVFFSRLSPGALIHFFRNAEFKIFEKEGTILREGDKADSMMMVVSGEINLFIGGKRVKKREKDTIGETDIVLCEGDIVGEMGLFNPGERRTATLKASRRTITLSLEYRFLKPVEGSLSSEENTRRMEIQQQIWRYYCDRTTENHVNSHPLLQMMSTADRSMLHDTSEFLPADYREPIQLSVEDVWNSWILVVAGSVVVNSKKDNRRVEYGQNSCIGPIRLVTEELPYTNIEIVPGTHLIRFPWSAIKRLVEKGPEFLTDWAGEGFKERMKLGLI